MSNGARTDTAPRWQPSLRTYLILMNVILLLILFPTVSIYYFQKTSAFRDEQLQRTVADRTDALRKKAALLVRSISYSGTDAIAGYNFTFLTTLITRAVSNDPELIGCHIVSTEGTGAESAGFGFKAGELEEFKAALRNAAQAAPLFPKEENDRNPPEVLFHSFRENGAPGTEPILVAVAPVYVGGTLWGMVNATFSLKSLHQDIMKLRNDWSLQLRHFQTSFLTLTVIFLIIAILSALFLTRPLLRSIDLLRDGVDRVSGGDLAHKIFFRGLACEEFVILSRSFNDMTDSLRQAKRQLDDYSYSLEELVRERTRALEEAQAELVSQAHEAGMAEMAVGVLHNIGNAITPVKVATHLLLKRLRETPLRTNLVEALQTVPDAIAASNSLPEGEKRKVTAILQLLPQGIRDEFNSIIKDIEQISDKHRYIEHVIALQMNYARLKGRDELFDVNRVARDALEMLTEVLHKQNITLATSFQAQAQVRLEEGKLLQILINLIKNGCEAMATTPEGSKKLTVATFETPGDPVVVHISVRDSGCGFTPEEEKHFFSFGYSTKNRGTGFGLHSSANYLIANNGAIEARSEGRDLGAEFIIHLPSSQETHDHS